MTQLALLPALLLGCEDAQESKPSLPATAERWMTEVKELQSTIDDHRRRLSGLITRLSASAKRSMTFPSFIVEGRSGQEARHDWRQQIEALGDDEQAKYAALLNALSADGEGWGIAVNEQVVQQAAWHLQAVVDGTMKAVDEASKRDFRRLGSGQRDAEHPTSRLLRERVAILLAAKPKDAAADGEAAAKAAFLAGVTATAIDVVAAGEYFIMERVKESLESGGLAPDDSRPRLWMLWGDAPGGSPMFEKRGDEILVLSRAQDPNGTPYDLVLCRIGKDLATRAVGDAGQSGADLFTLLKEAKAGARLSLITYDRAAPDAGQGVCCLMMLAVGKGEGFHYVYLAGELGAAMRRASDFEGFGGKFTLSLAGGSVVGLDQLKVVEQNIHTLPFLQAR